MRLRPLALVLVGMLLGAGAVAAPSYAPKSFKVGIGQPVMRNGRPLLAATAAGGSLNVQQDMTCTYPDGHAEVHLNYLNASSQVVAQHTLMVPANRTNAITDMTAAGKIITSTVPAGTGSVIDSQRAGFDSQISTAASGGLLNL